jgi:elongation factor Ts
MGVSIESIKELRNMTSASIAQCKKALVESKGDIKEAAQILRKRGLEIALKTKSEGPREGRIESYVHLGNKIGVLLEVNCDTDFVARNEDFIQFTKDISMQIAACNPAFLRKEDVSADKLKEEKDKEEFYKSYCLLEQPFVKDPSLAVKDYLGSLVAKLGENIAIRRFVRYKIGE